MQPLYRKMTAMRTILLLSVLFLYIGGRAQTIASIESRRIELPSGWHLAPVGKSLPLGDLPLNNAVSGKKQLMAVTNNGQSTQSMKSEDNHAYATEPAARLALKTTRLASDR